ncbi:MAG: phosphoribosylformylglycinamidine synthase, partial [Clostridia bacterium]|nr:phosphoribosylformylglycinamidine synthase [Clostridia bacterium]
MVYRLYAEKKPGFDIEAQGLLSEIRQNLGVTAADSVRIMRRYDIEGLDQEQFDMSKNIVFSEPNADNVYLEDMPETSGVVFATAYLPGQYDQRADSAAQCVQLITCKERPRIKCANVYVISGELSDADVDTIKGYLINPVESSEVTLEKPETLDEVMPVAPDVPVIEGFISLDDDAIDAMVKERGMAMTKADLICVRDYFASVKRDPTETELKVIDTYWSDHCRHTTFLSELTDVSFGKEAAAVEKAFADYLAARKEINRVKPVTLMDIATIAPKLLTKWGMADDLDVSDEINACSINVTANIDGVEVPYLIMFKNETHNHPTEIEPFGGAATCLGGAIRDPLSGRSYVYQAMRITGCADVRKPHSETLEGKLSQRKISTGAAAGYSSYGNQIGLATGHVAEVYHPGYVAKRLECGAVVAAAPAENVVRERPAAGDKVILLGGRTGRDGIGGATGSSKSHNTKSLTTMASEVQKGNAPEERKIQRLFRNGEVTRLIKRCNDFGAGGVSVAIGELADGLTIELDAVRKKYEGLDGTEIAISESQERMAVVVAPEDVDAFIAAASRENLEAYVVATVTDENRMVMHWKGNTIADLSRDFLATNGAVKHADISVPAVKRDALTATRFTSLRDMAGSLACASRRGLVERFDSTIGAGSLLMPFGGKTQRTPTQAMAALLPVLPGQHTEQGSLMAWGCDPDTLSASPYDGAYGAVYTSMAKLVAAGADYTKAYLSFQEFFERLKTEPARWGKPFAALLGALDAQLELGAAAIGGKDSMSGSFMDMDVPPTLISFAVCPVKAGEVLSPEFKAADHGVYLFDGTTAAWEQFHMLAKAGKVAAAWAVEQSVSEGLMKMSFGNGIGFTAEADVDFHRPMPGAIIAEVTEAVEGALYLGKTGGETITLGADSATIAELLAINEAVLEDVYPTIAKGEGEVPTFTYEGKCNITATVKNAKPKVLIPVFPGTNCEYD